MAVAEHPGTHQVRNPNAYQKGVTVCKEICAQNASHREVSAYINAQRVMVCTARAFAEPSAQEGVIP